MHIILFDDQYSDHLLPLTFTKPVAELRIGILKIREKWEQFINGTFSYLTKDYLSKKFPLLLSDSGNLFINGALIPNLLLVQEILELKMNEALIDGDRIIAYHIENHHHDKGPMSAIESCQKRKVRNDYLSIKYSYDIFSLNGVCLEADYELLTKDRKSAEISSSNQLIGDQVFLEEGARVECAILNSNAGPVYIGKDSEVMEGSIIRGPFALCDHSATKLATKIYGPTTIGPHSKVGGELNNVIIQGFSNKAHDGFLGNAVIGEWCNIGADSNNSNLKNNYAEVKLWDYITGRFPKTGLQFCGLIMGDHSKCAINTMFNTGTVVGVFANIFGAGFPRNFIPSFSWGGPQGMKEYKYETALEVASLVMKRRGLELDNIEKDILKEIFDLTQKYRRF